MYHAPVETIPDKVNRLEELDLAMSGTQTSSISCDTIPVAHAACKHGSFDRSASVSSTAGTLTRSMAHAQAAPHGAVQTTMRASSQGSKVCLQWPYAVQLCPLAICVLTEGARLGSSSDSDCLFLAICSAALTSTLTRKTHPQNGRR